jgi:hypothetical protein
MAGTPTSPPPSERSGVEPIGDENSELAGHGERYGPVVVSRYLKDDGRALLLYTRSAGTSA